MSEALSFFSSFFSSGFFSSFFGAGLGLLITFLYSASTFFMRSRMSAQRSTGSWVSARLLCSTSIFCSQLCDSAIRSRTGFFSSSVMWSYFSFGVLRMRSIVSRRCVSCDTASGRSWLSL